MNGLSEYEIKTLRKIRALIASRNYEAARTAGLEFVKANKSRTTARRYAMNTVKHWVCVVNRDPALWKHHKKRRTS